MRAIIGVNDQRRRRVYSFANGLQRPGCAVPGGIANVPADSIADVRVPAAVQSKRNVHAAVHAGNNGALSGVAEVPNCRSIDQGNVRFRRSQVRDDLQIIRCDRVNVRLLCKFVDHVACRCDGESVEHPKNFVACNRSLRKTGIEKPDQLMLCCIGSCLKRAEHTLLTGSTRVTNYRR